MNHSWSFDVCGGNFKNKLKSWGLERKRTIHLPIKKCMALATAMVQLHSTQFLLGFAQLLRMITLIQLSTKRRLNGDVCWIWFKWKKLHRANSISKKTNGIYNWDLRPLPITVASEGFYGFPSQKMYSNNPGGNCHWVGGKHPNLCLSGGFNPTSKGKPTP